MKRADKKIRIGNRLIAEDSPCFIIAEIGGNHGGKLSLAYKMIDAAIAAGADAVKFQTYKTDDFAVPSYPGYDDLKREELSFNDFKKIARYCSKRRTIFLSTPFDFQSVDLLSDLSVPAFKVASGDINNLPLINYILKKRKPVILSTGASSIKDIQVAVNRIRRNGAVKLILLHCISSYPAPLNEMNLKALPKLAEEFNCVAGLSDHTMGLEISLGAVALGAKVIEKHFTINNDIPGGDNSISSTPKEFKNMVDGIRKLEAALGESRRGIAFCEKEVFKLARRSLVANKTLYIGQTIKEADIGIKRPSGGMNPKYYYDLISKKVMKRVKKGEFIKNGMVKI